MKIGFSEMTDAEQQRYILYAQSFIAIREAFDKDTTHWNKFLGRCNEEKKRRAALIELKPKNISL